MSNSTPTPEAIEALALELATSPDYDTGTDYESDARWILSRFVRREEHCKDCCCARSWAALGEVSGADSISGHIENMRAERDRLRAELRGQRCDGSGYLRGVESQNVLMCPSCPACKPDATPKGDGGRWAKAIAAADPGRDDCDGGRTRESVSTAEGDCSDTDFAAIGKARDESYAAGYSAGRDDAARLNVQSVEHVVKLHPETVRALVAGMVIATGREKTFDDATWIATSLLAKLEEAK